MQNLEKVPCLNVTKENLNDVWPSLISKVATCSFIGIDFEFSGIGDRIDYGIKDLELRYDLLNGVVKERSILSVGLSFFTFIPPLKSTTRANRIVKRKKLADGELENEIWKYKVSNFNLFCECEGEYVKEEQALEFLKKHGFDFEEHSKNAIKYKKGNDEDENKPIDKNEISIRNLFNYILKFRCPIVIHNGLLDLMYFYHHFYCQLPENVQLFVNDVYELFKGGIYDTKFICELNTDLKISFLEYLFYYTQRMNILKIAYDDDYLIMNFDQLNESAGELEEKNLAVEELDKLIDKVELEMTQSLSTVVVIDEKSNVIEPELNSIKEELVEKMIVSESDREEKSNAVDENSKEESKPEPMTVDEVVVEDKLNPDLENENTSQISEKIEEMIVCDASDKEDKSNSMNVDDQIVSQDVNLISKDETPKIEVNESETIDETKNSTDKNDQSEEATVEAIQQKEEQSKSNKEYFDYGNLKTQILKTKPEDLKICSSYRNYGWCKDKEDCTKSHNIDFILDSKFDNSKTKNRYTKDLKKMKELNESKENYENDNIIKFSEKGGVHSAGFDAFMTAFCFAYFVLEYYEDMPPKMDKGGLKRKLRFVDNRIYIPFTTKHTLHIRKSEFANFSRNHRIKCDKIFGVAAPTNFRKFKN